MPAVTVRPGGAPASPLYPPETKVLVFGHSYDHLNVAPCGVGVGADLVGARGNLSCNDPVHFWKDNVERHVQTESAEFGVAQVDPRSNAGALDGKSAFTGSHLECTVEAGRITRGEQLLGIGAVARSTHGLRDG